MQKSRQSDRNKGFEARLARLEEIGEALKTGGIELDKAYALFEEGILLARSLEKELDKMERRIEILVNRPEEETGGKPELELFAEDES